jgi:hypothetical protein
MRRDESCGSNRIRVDFDFSEVSPTTAIVETVANATGQDELAMEPLADSVPPDPIDSLFRTDRRGNLDRDAQLTVTYSGFRVTVKGDGTVTAQPL